MCVLSIPSYTWLRFGLAKVSINHTDIVLAGTKRGLLDSFGSSSDLRCWGLIPAFDFNNPSHGPSGALLCLCHLCRATTYRVLEKSRVEQGGADVGQPLMAPWGQIFANYTTNYTVGCCNRSQSKQQHHLNQTELVQPASESTPRHCTSPFMTHLQFSASSYAPISSPSCWLHSWNLLPSVSHSAAVSS